MKGEKIRYYKSTTVDVYIITTTGIQGYKIMKGEQIRYYKSTTIDVCIITTTGIQAV